MLTVLLSAFSAKADNSGDCGDGVTYTYNTATKTLIINKSGEGTGAMNDYYFTGKNTSPWNSYRNDIQTIIVESGVTSIGEYSFYFCNATSVEIAESVTSIGYGAFKDCKKITSLSIPNSVVEIGGFAFSGMEALLSFVIPESVTSIGKGAFSTCFKLQSITLPNSITEILDNTFYGCHSLVDVVIPDGVISIGGDAFDDCEGLNTITIPNSVKTIKTNAFKNCTGLKRVNINGIESWCKIDFEDYGNPLYYAHSLYVNGNAVHELDIPDEIDAIKTRAFCGFSELQSINIGSSVTSIGENAFLECTSLQEVTIPQSVVSIGSSAFSSCSNLKRVSLPPIQTISSYTFSHCSSLQNILIPNGVNKIEQRAFYDCKNLQKLFIQSDVQIIELGAFGNCIGLTDVYCYGIIPPVHNGYYKRDVSHMFMGSSFKTSTLHVPEAAVENYKNNDAYPWCDFGSIVALTDEETKIEQVINDSNEVEQIYSLDGRRIESLRKGVNIIKKGEKYIKLYVK